MKQVPSCHPDRPHKAHGLCRHCYNKLPHRVAYEKKYRSTNSRRDQLKHKYNITPQEYEAILAKQQGVCAICKKTKVSRNRLPVDHCHSTGRVRGILCIPCNRALGYFENPDWHWSAVAYLANPDAAHPI